MSSDNTAHSVRELTPTVIVIEARDSKVGMSLEEITDAAAQIRATGFVVIPGVEPRITATVGWTGGIKRITAKGSRRA